MVLYRREVDAVLQKPIVRAKISLIQAAVNWLASSEMA